MSVDEIVVEDDPGDRRWYDGYRMAWVRVLQRACQELGYDDPAAAQVKWIAEREEVRSTLRSFCTDWGDNDWTDDLHLRDVIEKHLRNHIEENAVEVDE